MNRLLYSRDHQDGEAHAPSGVPDFGDVHDNAVALHLAFDAIEHGESPWACDVLRRLRAHIQMTRDVQSLQWIVPQVDVALRGWCTHPGMRRSSADPS